MFTMQHVLLAASRAAGCPSSALHNTPTEGEELSVKARNFSVKARKLTVPVRKVWSPGGAMRKIIIEPR